MKKGDEVFITFDHATIRGEVALASENGESLMLAFVGLLGGYLMMMPVLKNDDGKYVDLIKGEEVTLTRVQDFDDSQTAKPM